MSRTPLVDGAPLPLLDETLTLRAFKPESDFTYDGLTDIGADIEVIIDTDIVAADLGL